MKQSWTFIDVLQVLASAITVAALCIIMLDAFQAEAFFSQSLWLAFVCSMLISLACLFVGRGFAQTIFGLLMLGICLGFFAFLSEYMRVQGFIAADNTAQTFAPLVLLCGLAIIASALQRLRFGAFVLIALVFVLAAIAESMYSQGRIVEYGLALLGACAIMLLSNYQRALIVSYDENTMSQSSSDGAPASMTLFLGALLCVSMIIGMAAYDVVLAPLNLPSIRIMLTEVPNQPEELSEEEQQEEDMLPIENENMFELLEDSTGAGDDISLLSMGSNPAVIGTLLVILVLLTAYLGKRLQRKIQQMRLFRGNKNQQIARTYDYLLKRFERLHFRTDPLLTPRTFVDENRDYLARFERCGEMGSFEVITQAFEMSYYGDATPRAEEINLAKRYCSRFPKGAARFDGRFKYILKFWLI